MSKSFYKVRQKSTGLFYKASTNSRGRWGTGGKVYNSFSDLYADWKIKIENGVDCSDIEIVEYPVDYSVTIDILDAIGGK